MSGLPPSGKRRLFWPSITGYFKRRGSFQGTNPQVVFACLAAYLFILAGLATLNSGLLVLALPVGLYLASAIAQFPSAPNITAVRRLSDGRVVDGAEVEVELVLKNHGKTLNWVEIEDPLPDGLEWIRGARIRHLSLRAGEVTVLKYVLRARRGCYRFSHIAVKSYDPLGLLHSSARVEAENELWVTPRTVPLTNLHLLSRRTIGSAGTIPTRLGGPGVSFLSVREYQPGDELRRVNWRASQRRQDEIYTNEFVQERATNVGIILDVRQATNIVANGLRLFEYSVTAAASLSKTLLDQGNRVGLMLYGLYLDWTTPGYGRLQQERILQSLARAEVGKSHALNHIHYLPTQLFAPKSQIILISPLVEEDVNYLIGLRARGYEVLVVSLNPVQFELSGQSAPDQNFLLAGRIAMLERKLMLRALRQAGVLVVDWDSRHSLDQAIRAHSRSLHQPMLGRMS